MPYVRYLRAQLGRASLGLCLCLMAALSQAAISKPPFDHRDYGQLVLDNGMEAILVSDNRTRQAAMALEVGVGSFADPDHLQGLAHLVEHALLLGDSSRLDGRFREFVSRNRGRQNGQTSYEFTRYQVSLDGAALPEALNRFGDLLRQPRFSAEALSGELKILDEEFALVRKKDLWRYRAALQGVTGPDHPFRKLAAGNLRTLGQSAPEQLHAAAVEFMQRYYRPGNMRLVVVGNQSLGELERMVRTAFGQLPSGPVERPRAVPLLSQERLPLRLEIRTQGEAPTLSLLFPLPKTVDLNSYQPVAYIKYALEHQGPGSLQQRLREQGYIGRLSIGEGLGLGGQQTLSLAFSLTPKGVAQHEALLAEVFSALASLREQALNADLYESFRGLLAVQEFMPQENKPAGLAMHLLKQWRNHDTRNVRRGEFLVQPFNAAHLGQVLAALNPDNSLVILAHEQAQTQEVSTDFNIAYGVHAIAPEQLAQWRQALPMAGLRLTAGNGFLPQDLRITAEANDTAPELVHQTERVQLWHAFNRMGNTPRAILRLALETPRFGDQLEHRVLGELWRESASRRLRQLQERVEQTGQSLSIYSHDRGITLKISAFRDQAVTLARLALAELGRPLQPAEFETAKASLIRQWRAPRHKYAFEPLVDELKSRLIHSRWPGAQMAEALNGRGTEDFRSYQASLWRDLKLVGLGVGQIGPQELTALSGLLNDTLERHLAGLDPVLLKTAQASAAGAEAENVARLPEGERHLLQIPLGNRDNALVYYHQGDLQDLREEAMLKLLTPLLKNAYFDEIRNRRQLAYGVLVAPVQLLETPGLSFIIQSNKADPAQLTEATEEFLGRLGQYLRTLDPAALQRLKAGLAQELALENMPAEDLAGYFWQEIGAGRLDFARRQHLAEAIGGIGLNDLVAYVETELAGPRQQSLVLQGWNDASWAARSQRIRLPAVPEIAPTILAATEQDAAPIEAAAAAKEIPAAAEVTEPPTLAAKTPEQEVPAAKTSSEN